VSSANNLSLASDAQFCISLTYMRKNRGPRIEPCGTPQVMSKIFDLASAETINCLRFAK